MASSDISAVTNLIPTPNEGFTTTVAAPGVTSGGAAVPLASVTGLTNGTVFVGIVEPGLTNEQTFTGTVDTAGVQITGAKWTRGNNAAHAAGVTVVDYVTGTGFKMLAKAVSNHVDQDGTLKAGAVDGAGVLASDVVTTVKITDANVTTAKIADANVTTAKINNAAVTADKLATGAAFGYAAPEEATASTSFTDLATTTDTVTVTIGANGLAFVTVKAMAYNSVSAAAVIIGFAVSGASTIAADYIKYGAFAQVPGINYQIQLTNGGVIVTGLTPGSTTFKMKYRVASGGSGAGSGTFSNRSISVVPL